MNLKVQLLSNRFKLFNFDLLYLWYSLRYRVIKLAALLLPGRLSWKVLIYYNCRFSNDSHCISRRRGKCQTYTILWLIQWRTAINWNFDFQSNSVFFFFSKNAWVFILTALTISGEPEKFKLKKGKKNSSLSFFETLVLWNLDQNEKYY